jgi:hypothetical protein
MNPGHIVVQSRDVAVLHELSQSRAVAVRHLAQLYFNQSRVAAYKRLQLLCRAGLTSMQRTPPGLPDVVQLTRQGYSILSDHHAPAFSWSQVQRRQRVRLTAITHELAVMDVKSSLARGSRLGKMRCFSTAGLERVILDPMGQRSNRLPLPTPDAYIQTFNGGRLEHFFLELDTGSQCHQVIEEKIRAYRQSRCVDPSGPTGHRGSSKATAPFRVLVVCLTPRRRDELIACLQHMRPPVRTFAIVTLLKDLEAGRNGHSSNNPES